MFNFLVYTALHFTSAINAVIINSFVPVLIVIFNFLFFKERFSLVQSLGILISLLGVINVITSGDLIGIFSIEYNYGDLFIVLSSICWALYSVNLKRMPKNIHPFSFLTGIFSAGLILIIPFFYTNKFYETSFTPGLHTFSAILYVSIFASILAFIFWNRGIKELGANKVGPFVHLMPVFSSILSVIFLGESFRLFHLIGFLLIVTGIFLSNKK